MYNCLKTSLLFVLFHEANQKKAKAQQTRRNRLFRKIEAFVFNLHSRAQSA